MTTKHTLMSLCQEYNKIEIPIIQRDYAQGRPSQKTVRSRFVEYLIQALVSRIPVELDFVYGNIREDNNKTIRTFIPIDGQQRLTTLWLLHWFLAVREKRLDEIRPWMQKFTYETRPSSHSFCCRLLSESFPSNQLNTIDDYIVNQKWFDNEWNNDGTVSGMLRMIREFCNQQELLNGSVTLDYLLEGAISFYFVPLELFGLSDELYIRMNARGKVLTDFENFKSEFYKILRDYPRLEEVKDKMEQQWVEHLWPYRKKDVFVIDNCFMNYLRFITRMLYFRQAKPRADKYHEDFLDMNLLRTIYADKESTDFLLFALDVIPVMANQVNGDLLWEKSSTSLANILATAIRGSNLTIDMMVILYAALRFLYHHGEKLELKDFVRVVRNLIYNTNDKSERDQPRILRSIDRLSTSADVYEIVASENFKLEGLRDSQCNEEHFKALLRYKNKDAKGLIERIEDNSILRGNITCLLAGTYVKSAKDIAAFELSDNIVELFDIHRLAKLYVHYLKLSKDDFNMIWGDLLNTMLYTHHKAAGRMMFGDDDTYCKNPAIIALTVAYMDSKEKELEEFLIKKEKREICRLSQKYSDLGVINNVKQQLFIYYVITRRIMGLGVNDFFRKGWRIGWLSKEKGFTSLFHNGIEGDPWFSEAGHNPIFQTYGSQFRYNWGLNANHALPPEVVGAGRPHNLFDKLIEWANT